MAIRPLMLAWLLLLGATLAMGGVAWWLLGREVARVESLADATLGSRAAAAADNVDLLMEEIKAGVMDSLLVIRESPSPDIALADMVASNPYVRAGYVYRTSDSVTNWYGQRNGLPTPLALAKNNQDQSQYFPWSDRFRAESPLPQEPTGGEGISQRLPPQAASAAQTDSDAFAPSDLFDAAAPARPEDKRESLQLNETDAEEAEATGNVSFKYQRAAVRQLNVEQLNRAREQAKGDETEGRQMLAFAAVPTDQVADDAVLETGAISRSFVEAYSEAVREDTILQPNETLAPLPRQGWAVVDHDRREQWMAWVDLPASERFLGAWLKRDTVIAELQKSLYNMQTDGLTFELVDAGGRRIQAMNRKFSNSYSFESVRKPDMVLAVGTALPGWRIEVTRAGDPVFGRSFRVLGGLIVVGLCLGILCGGTLLLWQARRDSLEAKRKTTFVANVSHELKTPLTSIRLFAEMLHDGRASDPEKQRSYLRTMLNETQRLTRLVNNVLDFSRLERGRRDFKHESHDLVDLIQSWVETQRERLLGDGLTVELDLPDELRCEVDPDALEQILLNLLDNAAKYAATGERAVVTLKAQDEGWSLSVSDFGPGIPAAERRRVFQSFHRVDDRLTADRPGCGLGLSIAARLAKGLDGELSLHSNKPSGCRFTLTVKKPDGTSP